MTELVQRDLNWARKITERLRLQATNYAEAREKVIATLVEARDGGAADLLGYASWTAYMAEVFGDAPLRLERDARQELVTELSSAGMSTRTIAPIVGVSNYTVHKDIESAGVSNLTPHPERGRGNEHSDGQWSAYVNESTGEVMPESGVISESGSFEINGPTSESGSFEIPERKITGRDGKQYARPEPRPKATPITDRFTSSITDLNRLLDRFHRITEDPAFRRNSETISALHRADINRAIRELQEIADAL